MKRDFERPALIKECNENLNYLEGMLEIIDN